MSSISKLIAKLCNHFNLNFVQVVLYWPKLNLCTTYQECGIYKMIKK